MSQSISILTLTVRSTGAIARGRAVGFDGAQASVAGQKVQGIAKFPALAAGEDVAVDVKGTAIVEAGAAIAVGDTVVCDAQGRAVPGTVLAVAAGATGVTSSAANGTGLLTGSNLPSWPVGDALTAAIAAGQFIEVLMR